MASSYIPAPNCSVSFASTAAGTADTLATVRDSNAIFDSLQGSCQAPIVFYDGGNATDRYVFFGEMKGSLQISDLEFTMSSGTPTDLDTDEITTDDVLLTNENELSITVNFGTNPLLVFTKCSALFSYPDVQQIGETVIARGNYPYRIWDPDSEAATIS